MKRVVIVAALLAAPVAQAQVYKCTEGGRTVYSQNPCTADVQPMNLNVHHPSSEEVEMARRKAAADAKAQAIRDESRRRADERREMARALEPKEVDECERMQQEYAEAKRWEGEFRHPANIRREQEKAKKLASDSFFRCGPGKRISESR